MIKIKFPKKQPQLYALITGFTSKIKSLEKRIQSKNQALKAVQERIAYIGHPQEPSVKGYPTWDEEIKLIKKAMEFEFKKLKKKKKNS